MTVADPQPDGRFPREPRLQYAIECTELKKAFPQNTGYREMLLHPFGRKDTEVLHGINLAVPKGHVLGLMGPNGAGKTTLVKLLCTLLIPSGGDASVHGCSVLRQSARVRDLVALVTGDERSFYWRLTGRQNIEFFAGIYGLSGVKARDRISTVCEMIGIGDELDQRFDCYSTGMRQKLSLARGMLRDVPVLLLDEPTRSLDPDATEGFLSVVRRLAGDEDRTVLFITHRTDEVIAVCDRVCVLNEGRLAFDGPTERFSALVRSRDYHLVIKDLNPTSLGKLTALLGEQRVHLDPETDPAGRGIGLSIPPDDPGHLSQALNLLIGDGATVLHCGPAPARGLAGILAEEERNDG